MTKPPCFSRAPDFTLILVPPSVRSRSKSALWCGIFFRGTLLLQRILPSPPLVVPLARIWCQVALFLTLNTPFLFPLQFFHPPLEDSSWSPLSRLPPPPDPFFLSLKPSPPPQMNTCWSTRRSCRPLSLPGKRNTQ